MKTNSLKLIVLTIGFPIILVSCAGPTYVQQAPPSPAYEQAPPPPPPAQQQTYTDQSQQNQTSVQQQDAPPPVITYQTYYNELSPYGQWVYTPDYGNVWVPSAGADFQPYGTCGHWVLTAYGWTWVSDYTWGWATFHYGRWEFDGVMGWFWIPGYEWAPAWVSWRSSPGYYGWCPLGPTYVAGGYATYYCPPERYVFVNATYINSPNVYNYYQPRTQNNTYYSGSNVVSNTYSDNNSHATYYAGPLRSEVEKYVGAPVQPASMVSSSTPEKGGVTGNQVMLFRPAVQQPKADDAVKPAPAKLYQKSEIVPVTQRPVLTKPNQPRVAPYKPENIQPKNNTVQPEQKQQQKEQQRPPVQQQQQQQKQPVQEQQKPQVQQQQQKPQQQQQVQRQQQPQQQQQPQRQQQKQPKPQKQPKQPKPKPQNQQGGPQKKNPQ
jgi:hypothetical protein